MRGWWEALQEFLRREDGNGTPREAGSIAGNKPIGRAGGCRGGLEAVFVIGDSVTESPTGFRIAQRGDFREAEDLMDGGQSGGGSGLSFCHVIEGGQTMARDEEIEAGYIATVEYLFACGEEGNAPLDNVEQDIRIEKDSHGGSDAVLFTVIIHPHIIGGLAGL